MREPLSSRQLSFSWTFEKAYDLVGYFWRALCCAFSVEVDSVCCSSLCTASSNYDCSLSPVEMDSFLGVACMLYRTDLPELPLPGLEDLSDSQFADDTMLYVSYSSLRCLTY